MRPVLALAVGLTLAVSGIAVAGGQQIAVEVAKDGGSLLVRTYRCGTPSEFTVTGSAEGVVDGQMRSLPLKLTRTSDPSVFAVDRQWPSYGRWVLTFQTEGGLFVNALVELQPGAPLRITSQESTYKKITPSQIAAALQRLSRS
jgi:hypothetical protein